MNPSIKHDKSDPNVTGIFSKKVTNDAPISPIISISPELAGIKMIYQCDDDARYYSLPILCWSILASGRITGLVAWQGSVCPCDKVQLAYGGKWVGYQSMNSKTLEFEAPESKRAELQTMTRQTERNQPLLIPDIIGTHALLLADREGGYNLKPVVGWRFTNGEIIGLFHNHYEKRSKPLSEQHLMAVDTPGTGFVYYFHYAIAKRVHAKEPSAMASMRALVSRLTL
ncbi:hypothetical protein [uncultured Umboniibacter sp.]|uniref:hypothetical protein n=1 Tax=uncultured Umboniibacter sp. TaxID=1798917 RepID=UPI002637466B|nr:hypothetical protein [uncultured Umboniibacter sp.]